MQRIIESKRWLESANRIPKRPPKSQIKVFLSPSRGLLGPLWTVLRGVSGRSWAVLGSLGRVLGGVLGRSWGLLDPLGAVLAAILGPSDHKIENQTAPHQWLAGSGVDFGSQNGSQNDPKTSPKHDKNQDEQCITCLSLLDPSWIGLEAILGPILGSKRSQNLGNHKSVWKLSFSKKWRPKTHFGLNLTRFGTQKGSKRRPRRVQNLVQNRSEKIIEKWTAQGSMTRIEGGHARPQVPTGGVGGAINQTTKSPIPKI